LESGLGPSLVAADLAGGQKAGPATGSGANFGAGDRGTQA